MTRTYGLADMTRAQISRLAELINTQTQQDDAMTKWTLICFDTDNRRKKNLYKSMAVKAQNSYTTLKAKVKKLAGSSTVTSVLDL